MEYRVGRTMSLTHGCIDIATDPMHTEITGLYKRLITDQMGHKIELDMLTGKVTTTRGNRGKPRAVNSPATYLNGDNIKYDSVIVYFNDGTEVPLYRKPPVHNLLFTLDPYAREMLLTAMRVYSEYKDCHINDGRAGVHHVDGDPKHNYLHNLLGLAPREHKWIHMGITVDTATGGRLRKLVGDYFTAGVHLSRLGRRPYADVLSEKLSAADLPADCTEVLVYTHNREIVSVDIANMSIWKTLTAFYRAGATEVIGDARDMGLEAC